MPYYGLNNLKLLLNCVLPVAYGQYHLGNISHFIPSFFLSFFFLSFFLSSFPSFILFFFFLSFFLPFLPSFFPFFMTVYSLCLLVLIYFVSSEILCRLQNKDSSLTIKLLSCLLTHLFVVLYQILLCSLVSLQKL